MEVVVVISPAYRLIVVRVSRSIQSELRFAGLGTLEIQHDTVSDPADV